MSELLNIITDNQIIMKTEGR